MSLGLLSCNTSRKSGEKVNDIFNKDSILILSLSPSITELIGNFKSDQVKLIGRTAYCNYPASVLNIEIVQTIPLDLEKIISLNPDYIIAKKGLIKSVEIERLEAMGLNVMNLPFETINEVKFSLITLGEIIQADSIQLYTYINKVIQSRTQPLDSFTYIAFASIRPYYVYGQSTFFSQLAHLEGGINKVESATQLYPEYDLEKIIISNPDVLFVSDSLHYFTLKSQTQFKNMNAVKFNRIYCLPADIMARPGARMDSLRYWIQKSTYND
jgi:ABC-type Fe3+-hydroxamate transport system substrate-binding protein